jgi:lipopolysaccharide biosynthesis regulator YciM
MAENQEPVVTQEDRDQMAKLYPQQREWTDAEIEMAKALGHL